MRTYPEYITTNNQWLGQVPKQWVISKLKYISHAFGRIGYRGYTTADIVEQGKGAITISPSNLKRSFVTFENNTYINWEKYEESPEIKIFNDDILIVKTGSTYGKIGLIKGLEEPATINPQLLVLKNIKANPISLFHLLCTQTIQGQIETSVIGSTIPTISQSKILDFSIALPSLPEQKQIARYLDHQTGVIDALTAKKQTLIEKLKEQRQATINEAVTKGLNPNAPLKDSGIEWLGEIPAHWELVKLKYLSSKIGSGVTPRGGSEVYVDEGIVFLRSQNIYSEEFRLNDIAHITQEIHDKMKNSQVRKGDVLLNITGASIGRCNYWDKDNLEANVNQHVCIIRPNSKIEPAYLQILMISQVGQEQIFSGQDGTSREGLNFEELKNFKLILPPSKERSEIKKFIEDSTNTLDQAKNKLEAQIEKLQEYRQSVISEAVTGKIDLRNWEPNT